MPATPHKPADAILATSPFRMMPAMADGDFIQPDSTAIEGFSLAGISVARAIAHDDERPQA